MVAPPEIPEVVELYAVEPDEFVAARTDLARRLRADGRRPDAALVAKLRRPRPGAWALDRVAVTHPELLDAALTAGAELRAAMEQAVSGDASGLRDATRADRVASEAVLDAAGRLLEGRSAALRTKLAATLRAAVLDDEVAADLRRGVLAEDHDAPGFGLAGFAVPESVATRRVQRNAKGKAAVEPKPRAEPVPDPLEVKRAARERRQRRAALEAEAERAETAAEDARAEADAAGEAADAAARALDDFDTDTDT